MYTTGLNYYREHIKPTARIHYDIEKAGDVVNVVPEYAQIWTRLRENDNDNVDILYERAKKIAEAAAMMAGVKYELSLISGIYEIIPNRAGAAVMQKNLELLGDIEYSEYEINYANTILKETGKEPLGIDGKIKPIKPTMPAVQIIPDNTTAIGTITAFKLLNENKSITTIKRILSGKIFSISSFMSPPALFICRGCPAYAILSLSEIWDFC